jgi:hypothetical protein
VDEEDVIILHDAKIALEDAVEYLKDVPGVTTDGIRVVVESLVERLNVYLEEVQSE